MARKAVVTDSAGLIQAIGLLVRRVRAAAPTHELSLTESSVLARLEREGSATAAELARAEGMKPQSMGTTVAALEERGLVARKAHPTDGRQMNIELTAKGLSLRRSVKDAKHTWLAQAIAQLDRKDQEILFGAGEIIQKLAEK